MENEVGGGSGPPFRAEDVGKEGRGGIAPAHPPSLQSAHHPGAAHLAGVSGKGSAELGRAATALPLCRPDSGSGRCRQGSPRSLGACDLPRCGLRDLL